jgi:hypothetical protein
MGQALRDSLPEDIYFLCQIKLIDPVGTPKQTTHSSKRVVNNVEKPWGGGGVNGMGTWAAFGR